MFLTRFALCNYWLYRLNYCVKTRLKSLPYELNTISRFSSFAIYYLFISNGYDEPDAFSLHEYSFYYQTINDLNKVTTGIL